MSLFDLLNMMLIAATDGGDADIAAVQDALRENKKASWADYIASQDSLMRKRKAIVGLAYDLRKEIEDDGRNRIRMAAKALQKSCPHKGKTNYYPDPSGNNDSWDECQECGAEV